MDAFVLPSIDEGLPMVMLEAMAARTPVIATAVGDVPKVLRDGENGMLVEPGNSDALAEKIFSLLHQKPLRQQFVEKAFRTVSRFHSKEAMCGKYLDVYAACLPNTENPELAVAS